MTTLLFVDYWPCFYDEHTISGSSSDTALSTENTQVYDFEETLIYVQVFYTRTHKTIIEHKLRRYVRRSVLRLTIYIKCAGYDTGDTGWSGDAASAGGTETLAARIP